MDVSLSYEKEFSDIIEKIEKEYGRQILNYEGIGDNLDLNKAAAAFFDGSNVADLTVDPNANVDDDSIVGFIVESQKPFMRLNSLYIMWKTIKKLFGPQKAEEAIIAEVTGHVYTHDLTGYSIKPYCWAMSAAKIAADGLQFIRKLKSEPAKHLDTYIEHITQTVMFMSNQIDGAVAIPDFLVIMSYYVKKDIAENVIPSKHKDPTTYEKVIKQNMQKFIYIMNQPVRWGQSPYTNISIFDRVFMEKVYGEMVMPDLSKPDFDLVYELQFMFMEVMEKEMNRQILTFPVMTLSMARDEKGLLDPTFAEQVAEFMLPHANYNIYIGEATQLSSCCRLRNDLKNMYMNSLGASNSSGIGSHRVCAINLPRLGIMSENKEELFKNLEVSLSNAHAILTAHRYIVRDKIKKGKLPLYRYGLMDLNRQYSTIGIIGMYELIELFGIVPHSEEGLALQSDILQYINKFIETKNEVKQETYYIVEFTDGARMRRVIDSHVNVLRRGERISASISQLKRYDVYKAKRVKSVTKHTEDIVYTFNVEQVPGESAAVKLLKKDRLIYGIDELNKYQLYSNQFTPLHMDVPIIERMRIHGLFDSKTGGGAILHINVAEKIQNKEVMLQLINAAVEHNVIYFAINYNFQQCDHDHYTIGSSKICPICGGKIIENYTRVVGFITPKSNWSSERRNEKRRWLLNTEYGDLNDHTR